MKKTLMILVALLAMLAACGGEGVPEICSRTQNIWNGQQTRQYDATGFLQTDSGVCSGTLIHTRTFLTTAHCVVEATSGAIYIGDSVYFGGSRIIHPDYQHDPTTATLNDLALIILDRDVFDVMPAPLSRKAPSVGDKVDIVGYGITNLNKRDAGIKRSGTTTVKGVDGNIFWFSGESSICSGDSGGSVYKDGRLIGVNWAGPMNSCIEGAATTVSEFIEWLYSNVEGECN